METAPVSALAMHLGPLSLKLIAVVDDLFIATLISLIEIAPDGVKAIFAPYGVPYAVKSASETKLPEESNEATFVPL
jgi:hypothetical protein